MFKRSHVNQMVDTTACKMLKVHHGVTESRQTRVQFGEVTVIVIPLIEESTSAALWWSPTDIQYFRNRKRHEQVLKQRLSAMTLVVTSNTERRASLASSLFQSSGCPHGKYIACEHHKLEMTLEILNVDFQRVVIDGEREGECDSSEQIVQKFCPFAYVLIVSSPREYRCYVN